MNKKIEKSIVAVIEDNQVLKKVSNLLINCEFKIEYQNLQNLKENIANLNPFCFVVEFDVLDKCNEDKFDFIQKIRQENPIMGIIILSENLRDIAVRKLLQIDNLIVVSPFVADEVAIYEILSFFKNLKNIESNTLLSKFIYNESKKYRIPNDLMVVKPITQHLIRDLVGVGIIDNDRLLAVKLGVQEMLINAIEHGNLQIDYEEKTNLLNNGENISSIISNRANLPQNRDKFVEVEYYLTTDSVKYVIRDQGNGFNWKEIQLEITEENFELIHGRGILISNKAFDEFRYNESGNEITMVIKREG